MIFDSMGLNPPRDPPPSPPPGGTLAGVGDNLKSNRDHF